ncbi:MAG: adenylyltransferase/cytidyltransferase family protein [Dehalococcoidales bacterium]|nr:adenylyltransferase/cytidyltransferase family protein [Dehalococcoidales bacterium]
MKEKTVTVSGGFDPLHIGHIRMICEASKLGKLIVILNNDAFLIRKKGRAFMPIEERKEILENIKGVDSVFVSIDEDDSVCKSLEAIKPDIFANGGDRKDESEIREAEVCKRLGIEMVFNVGGGKVQSSSWLTKPNTLDKE